VKRQKRNVVFQFRKMISCATGRSFWAYLPYGCYCGLGGSGIPVDDTDSSWPGATLLVADAAKLMMTVMIKYTENESVSLVPYGSGINDLDALAVLHQTTIVDVEFVSATEKQLVALPGQRMIKRTNLGVSETEGNINVWVLIK
ncbi:unnamed protein product, partial [Porites lobata]